MLNKEDLLAIAELAKINISPDEYSLYLADLDEIIKFASLLSDVSILNEKCDFADVCQLRNDVEESSLEKNSVLFDKVNEDGFVSTVKVVG